MFYRKLNRVIICFVRLGQKNSQNLFLDFAYFVISHQDAFSDNEAIMKYPVHNRKKTISVQSLAGKKLRARVAHRLPHSHALGRHL